MKRGDVIVSIVVVIIAVCAIFIAVTPKANGDEAEFITTEELSETEDIKILNADLTETVDFEVTTESITSGTTTELVTTKLFTQRVSETAKENTTSDSATTREYTYTTKPEINYRITKDEDCMTDVDYLATVIYTEAGSNSISDKTRQYVAEVVLNRVASDKYPNTIKEVLVQYKQYGTFYKTGVPLLNRNEPAVDRAYRIAESVLNGNREVPSNVIYQAEFPQGSGVWEHTDGIYFCYA